MEICSMPVHILSDKIKNRELSSVEITRAVIDRIKKIDPKIQSYITVVEDEALKKSREIQNDIDAGKFLSPIGGIPVAVKDNICTRGIPTTCASKMLSNFIPPYDATVIKKLKEQKAIIAGKLNMDEFAMGGSTENSFFKKTKNPWNTSCVPGGSSGGAAASVAAGLIPFALGSDTGGSIRQPASFCGVVGLKPTYGAVSRYGLVAFASSLDQIGPLTKNVTDCAVVMNAIAGYDKMDSTSANIEYPDYTGFLTNNIKGMKIGVPKEYMTKGINEDVRKALENAAGVLESLGAECEEMSLQYTEYSIPAYYLISSAEASSNLARYDGVKYGYRASRYTDLIDLYRKTRSEGFGEEVKRRIMLGTYALSSGYYDAYYKKALQVRTIIMDDFNRAFDNYDAVIGPTAPTTAYKIGEKIDNPIEMYLGDIFTASVNIAGLPAVSVPCGFDGENMPIGMQIIAKPFDEGTLIKIGYAFEQNTDFANKYPELD